ncbi:MAG: Cytochrome b, partial [uncultured Acidimicrobiales bacterium]
DGDPRTPPQAGPGGQGQGGGQGRGRWRRRRARPGGRSPRRRRGGGRGREDPRCAARTLQGGPGEGSRRRARGRGRRRRCRHRGAPVGRSHGGRRHRHPGAAACHRTRGPHPAPPDRGEGRLDPRRQGPSHRQGPHVAPPARRRVRGVARRHRLPARVLGLRQRPAAHARELQPHAEPVQGALVLPRAPGAAGAVPPDGGGRDDPRDRHVRPHAGPVHGSEPVEQARGPQVRHLPVHRLPDVLGGPHADGVVLPRSRVQLRVPVDRRPLLRAL